MKINVVYNKSMVDYESALEAVEQVLIAQKIEFKSFDLDFMENFGDFTIVIGGDGTLLKASRFYAIPQIPVMGINLGRLGFLSQAGVNEINNIIENVAKNDFFVEERLMLMSGNKLALNDFVIKGCKHTRTSKFFLEINDKFICDYIADGLIISTPTGSTAYGLSAGGPVIFPTMEAISIVPICPHTLNARPLVVPANEVITIKTSDELLFVTADGIGEEENCVSQITIQTFDKKARLAFLKDNNFYSVLRNKLHWGISPTAQ